MNTAEYFIGNIGDEKQARKVVATLQGKTYMNIQASTSCDVNNWPVWISTDYPKATKKELRNLAMFVIACDM